MKLGETMSGKQAFSKLSLVMVLALVMSVVIPVTRGGDLRDPTSIEMSPTSFEIDAGENVTIRAKLTSNGTPLEDKSIEFSTLNGYLDPLISTTNATGVATTTFTAPKVNLVKSAEITATYLGSTIYKNCTNTTEGTVTPIYESVNRSGAAFSVPKSVEDDIDDYRGSLNLTRLEEFGIDVPTDEFILAEEDRTSIVLSDKSNKGVADIEGWQMPTNITLANNSLEVIIADNVTFTKSGTPATIDEILSTPSQYQLNLVKIDSIRRQVSILCDPDSGMGLDIPVTSGYLTDDADGVFASINRAIDNSKNLTLDSNITDIKETLNLSGDKLPVFDFETDYWYNSTVETNAIVLTPGTPVLEFFKDIIPNGSDAIQLEEDLPVLYDVTTSFSAENVTSIEDIYNNTDSYKNEVISFTSKSYGGTISVQESLEHYTSCSEDRFPIPTPSGPVCVNIPVDVLLEGGVAWNQIELDNISSHTLLTVEASSRHQDEPYSNYSGEYRMIGKLIPISLFNQTSEGYIFIVFEKEKIGELNYQELGEEVRDELKEEVKEINSVLTDFTNITLDDIPAKEIIRSFSGVSDIPESIEFTNELNIEIEQIYSGEELDLGLNNFYLSGLSMSCEGDQSDVTVNIEKVTNLSLDVPAEKVYQSLEISVGNVDDSEITNASLEFSVSKDWMDQHNISKEDIGIYRYHDGTWGALSGTVYRDTDDKIYCRASTPGFSKFTIGAKSSEEDKTDPVARPGEDRVVKVGEEFTLNASASSDNVGVTSYVWDLDNGVTKSGQQCSVTYNQPGNYTVTLTVRDEAGNSDMDTLTVTVKESSEGGESNGTAENKTDGSNNNDGIPGFTVMTFLLGLSIVAFYISISKAKKN